MVVSYLTVLEQFPNSDWPASEYCLYLVKHKEDPSQEILFMDGNTVRMRVPELGAQAKWYKRHTRSRKNRPV